MGKFAKQIKNINKNIKYVLVFGSAFGNLIDLLEAVSTAFIVYPKDETIRAKNLIYREDIKSVDALSNIEIIIIDKDLIQILPEIQATLKRCRPLLMIEGHPQDSLPQHKFLKSENYQVIELAKHYHIWKSR